MSQKAIAVIVLLVGTGGLAFFWAKSRTSKPQAITFNAFEPEAKTDYSNLTAAVREGERAVGKTIHVQGTRPLRIIEKDGKSYLEVQSHAEKSSWKVYFPEPFKPQLAQAVKLPSLDFRCKVLNAEPLVCEIL